MQIMPSRCRWPSHLSWLLMEEQWVSNLKLDLWQELSPNLEGVGHLFSVEKRGHGLGGAESHPI